MTGQGTHGGRSRAARGAVAALLAFGWASASSSRASAQELRVDLNVDVPVTVAGFATATIAEVVLRDRGPVPCRWCDRDAEGRDTLNAVDRSARELRWSRPGAAGVMSDITGYFVTPLVAGTVDALAAGHDQRAHGAGNDLLVMAEAGILAANLAQLGKLLVPRERPDVHALRAEVRSARPPTVGDNRSFYSGHTTEAVSIAVAAGTVASLRNYRLAPVVWAGALTPALLTGYLRLAADRHYLTDVLVGAVTGALVGFLVPYVFHAPSSSGPVAPGSPATVGPMGQPYVLGYSGTW